MNVEFCINCGNSLQKHDYTNTIGTENSQSGPLRGMRPLSGMSAHSNQQNSTKHPNTHQSSISSMNYVVNPDWSQTSQTRTQPVQPQPINQTQPTINSNFNLINQQHISIKNESSQLLVNIWGPFAGYGDRKRHIGWLMDGKASYFQTLNDRIAYRLSIRQIPNLKISHIVLNAKGLIVESRPYFIVKKGLISLGLNVSQFGEDLFISMATYIKPPISNFRILILCLSVLFAIIGLPIMKGIISSAADQLLSSFQSTSFLGGSSEENFGGFLLAMLCVIGPIYMINGIALQLAIWYSGYKWLTEKDLIKILRVKPNEFNEDDLMALEKAVEQTIKSSLDDIGLDPASLRTSTVLGKEQRLV